MFIIIDYFTETDDGQFLGSCLSEIDPDGVYVNTLSLTVANDVTHGGEVELQCTTNSSLGEISSKSTIIELTGIPYINFLE